MIRVPDDSLLSVPLNELPEGWNEPLAPTALKAITKQWLSDNRFLLLKVPSAVVAGEYNFLINPAHPRMAEVVITTKEPFRFDSRLSK
nr:RES family NAD+ phosphorylase [Spirosoma radiotolerans]